MLGTLNYLHELLESSINILIEMINQQVAGTFNPLSDIRIPELVARNWPRCGRIGVARVSL